MQNLGAAPINGDPNAILNECREIDRSIDDLEYRLQELENAQRRFITSNDLNNNQINAIGASIMDSYRALGQRVKRIKSLPESGNPRNAPQVGKVDRRLKKAINTYQTVESEFRRRVREQQERQYRIVRPDATNEEVQQACEDPNQQIFQQAVRLLLPTHSVIPANNLN
jgi:syntaxin 1B/2/3